MHPVSSFWTFTYAQENLSVTPSGVGTLVPDHLSGFFKRLRRSGARCRYFAVGEYGDTTWRPHYHAALFGIPDCENALFRRRWGCECGICRLVSRAWGYGACYPGELTAASAAYVAGYVTKKLTARDDVRLGDRHPEFARMSLRPGIGYDAAGNLAGSIADAIGIPDGDVPVSVRLDGKRMPIGRYLRRVMREKLGYSETGGQPADLRRQAEEMRALLADSGLSEVGFRQLKPFVEHERLDQLEGRSNIWSKKGLL